MIQQHRYNSASLYSLTAAVLLAGGLVACGSMSTSASPAGYQEASFQLHILAGVEAQRLSHRASQSEYQAWLHGADLGYALLVLQKVDISSVATEQTGDLSLTLTVGASRKVVEILEPKLDAETILSGTHSLGCSESEKAFVIVARGERTVGGTLRCPTAMAYTHPDILPASRAGNVILTLRNVDAAVLGTIASETK